MQLRDCGPDYPIRCPTVPIILIRSDGSISFGTGLTEKREILTQYDADSKKKKKPQLLSVCVWPGQCRSDAFSITRDVLALCLLTESEYFKLKQQQKGWQ